jgi:hypothetical protein
MRRTVKLALVVVVGAGILGEPETRAAVITTNDGNGADTHVRSSWAGNNAANMNYGSSTIVGIKRDTALNGNNRKGYLRFDLSSIATPIEDATLQLVYAGRSGDPPANPSTYYVFGLNDGHAGELWDESTITWNNAPGNNTSSTNGFISDQTTLLGTVSVLISQINVGDVIEFTSPELIEFLQNDTNGVVTIMLSRQQQNFSIEYAASKEHASLAPAALIVAATGPIYVDDDNCPGPGSGSPADPFCTIQTAINAAVDTDEIIVAPGTYFETIDFLGKAVTVRSSDGPELTAIDAQQMGTVVTCNSGKGPETVLQGFTITGGSADLGGGMFNDGADPTVLYCTFVDNEATSSGGGMYNSGSSPMVSGCSFIGNTAFNGPAMDNVASDATISDCTFLENSGCNGGGMQNDAGAPTIVRCTFVQNSACNGGGIQNVGTSTPTVTDCNFLENDAGQGGGLLFTAGTTATVVNCTFIGNTATTGGGIWTCCNANATVVNCTFFENSADADGGGIRTRDVGSSATITNCIVWQNSPEQILDLNGAASIVSFSDVQNGWSGAGSNNIDAEPLFADPVGPDDAPGTADDDLRLQGGSPCIDAGDSTAVPVDVLTDLNGDPRFVDDPGTSDTGVGNPLVVEMGAYEFQGISDQGIEFGPPNTWAAFGAANREAVGDLDGDGDTDVVIAIPGPDPLQNGYVEVFLNQGNDDDGVWLGLISIGTVEIGREPSAVAVGDFDEDDHLDIAVTNAGDDNVQILVNDGAVPPALPTFLPQTPIPVGDQPSAIVAADLNLSTFTDLAVANKGDNDVLILTNDGGGGFTPGDPMPTGGTAPLGLISGTIDDEDKDPDLAGINELIGPPGQAGQPGSVFFFQSNFVSGEPGDFFPVENFPIGVSPTDLSLGDLDRDSRLDIVAVNGADATASLLINQGGGDFAAAPDLPVGAGPLSVEAEDLDGDVDADLAVVAEDPTLGLVVQVFENLSSTVGELLFGPPEVYDLVDDPQFVLSADFNGDGLNDLVTVNIEEGGVSGSVTVLLNNTSFECLAITGLEVACYGDGSTFTYTIHGNNVCTGGQTSMTFTGSGGAVGDEICFTLLVSDGGFCCTTTLCAVIPDCSPPPVPCDMDGDGVVGVTDLLDMLASWGPCGDCPDCAADLDRDCVVGVIDVLLLLENWG